MRVGEWIGWMRFVAFVGFGYKYSEFWVPNIGGEVRGLGLRVEVYFAVLNLQSFVLDGLWKAGFPKFSRYVGEMCDGSVRGQCLWVLQCVFT